MTPHLSLRQLQLAVAIAERGSVLKAAEAINVAQPTASKLLRDMEAEVRQPLFLRSNRGMIATEAGRELIRHGKVVLSQLDYAAQALNDLATGTGGRVAIGTLLTASASVLPKALAQVRRERRNVILKVVEGTFDHLSALLRSGDLDLVVGRLSRSTDLADMAEELLFSDTACIVARQEHPLFSGQPVQLDRLVSEDWILPPYETNLRYDFELLFRQRGLQPPVPKIESVSFLTNRWLQLNTDMLSVWPRSVIDSDSSGLAPLATEPTLETGQVGVYTRRNALLSPAAEAMIEALRTASCEDG
ncbi:LysR family transcriptional regulator [Sphingomonas populi]|uniref:LysR family transcriptional regulator n=1 Tax=Sphingomonas populi TaxID=2484750 RepID=A0A4V2DD24_9SPHN|nr:LysR substrate-binding domain-containing protein [Sphingomonas populi]RZF63498.1 LysR family transcriptional regulator [Sphingomonas populi]